MNFSPAKVTLHLIFNSVITEICGRHVCRVGQNRIYIRCMYSIFGMEITMYWVIYGVYFWSWPTLHIYRQARCKMEHKWLHRFAAEPNMLAVSMHRSAYGKNLPGQMRWYVCVYICSNSAVYTLKLQQQQQQQQQQQ